MRTKQLNFSNVLSLILTLNFLFLISLTTFSQGGVAINTNGTTADPSAILDIQSDTVNYPQGLLIPKMSTDKRNAIINPAEGLQIFNTTTKCLEIYISPIWQSTFCGCNPPASPTTGTHSPTQTEIVWNWNTVSGATGYKYNTANDYNTAIDNGTNTSFTQTGLTCNTSYTLYVWAYSACGNSSVTTLPQNTLPCFTCGTSNVTFTYNGNSVTYGTVVGQNGTCWMNRNLGSSKVAISFDDYDAYGDLFAWGRGDDGHQLRAAGATSTLSNNDQPGHSNYIFTLSPPWDWRNPQNNNLWLGVNGINNPCPNGWRLPFENELENERASWSNEDYNGAYDSPLKWTAAGIRGGAYNNCPIFDEGTYGYYWTSSVSGTWSRHMLFYDAAAFITYGGRADGMSVRCIKN